VGKDLDAEPYGYFDIVKGEGSNFLIPGYYQQSISNLNGAATKFSSSGSVICVVFTLIIKIYTGMLFDMGH